MNFSKVIKDPRLWLSLQALGMLVFVAFSGRFGLKYVNDSAAYLSYFPSNVGLREFLTEILTHYRTFGYPLFLKLTALISPSYTILPLLQYSIHVTSVLFFWFALRQYGFGKWTALAAASPLFYSRLILKYSNQVMSDSLGASLVIIVIAFLFLAVAAPGRRFPWIGLTLSFFLACQVRPIYIFLLGLIPVWALLLMAFHSGEAMNRKYVSQTLARCLVALGTPLLLFCIFRGVVTGKFGLTSYTGVNLMGMATPLLKSDMVETLPLHVRELAALIVKKRDSGGTSIGIDGKPFQWGAIESDRVRWRDHHKWLYANPDYFWKVVVPAAQEIYGVSNRHTKGIVLDGRLDDRLKELATAVIRARPHVYVQLVFLSVQKQLMEVLNTNLLLQFAFFIFVVSRLGYRLNDRKFLSGDFSEGAGVQEEMVMLVLGFFYFFLKVVLVSLLQSPQGRYYTAAEIFLTGILLTAAVAPWERLHRCRD